MRDGCDMLAFSSKMAQSPPTVLGSEAIQLLLMPLLVLLLIKEDLGDVISSHHNRYTTLLGEDCGGRYLHCKGGSS